MASPSSSSFFDNFEESESEWEVVDGGDDVFSIPGISVCGVFVPLGGGGGGFLSFKKSLSFGLLLHNYSVSASCNGLVLSRGPWSAYLISNPSSGAHAALPKPPGPHRSDSPLAIALHGSAYHVVAALAGAHEGSYAFSVFSSSTGSWRLSKEEFELDRIVANTGVSCNGMLYWRTETKKVAVYDVTGDRARMLMPPAKLKDRWQIGRAGENLCCVLVTGSNMEVYELRVDDKWMPVCSIMIKVSEGEEWDGGEPIVCREMPRPLRFESYEMEVLMIVDAKLVVVGLENRRMRMVELENTEGGRYDEFVPYVDDPLASVEFSVNI